MKILKLSPALVCLALVGGAAALTGCGAEAQQLDANYMQDGEKKGEVILDIYNKVGGDMSKLTPEDRKTLSDQLGGEAEVAKFFENVRNPRPRGGAPGPQ